MSLTRKETNVKTQKNLTKVLKMTTVQLNVIGVSLNPYIVMNMDEMRRIHQHPIPQVSRQVVRAPQVVRISLGTMRTNLRKEEQKESAMS